jgi:hypothetical protein
LATIQEILSGQSYRGDATSGGGAAVGVTLDPSPFQKLADFTYYQNREMWVRQNKKDDEAANNIADITALDPNSPLKEQYEYLSEKKNEIIKEIENNPSVLDYQKNPKGWAALNRKIAEWGSERKKATANDIIYEKRMKEAQDDVDPISKGFKMKTLEEDRANHFSVGVKDALVTGTTLRSSPELTAENYKLPTLTNTSYKVAYIEPNTLREVKWDIVDTNSAWVQAGAAAFGLMNKAYKDDPNLTPEENARMRATVETSLKMGNVASYQLIVDKYNEWMQKKASNPNEPMPPQIEEIVESISTYNKNAQEANVELAKMTAAGKKPTHGPNVIVDAKQLDVQEFLFLNALHGQKLVREYTEDLSWTGGANAMQMNREDNDAAMARARLPYTMAKLGTNSSGAGSKSGNEKAIVEPSMLFRENAIRTGDWFTRNPNAEYMELTTKNTDPATTEALGLKTGEYVRFAKDGSFKLFTKDGKQKSVGTPEEMFRRYKVVSAGKLGKKEGENETAMAQGFQVDVEDGMFDVFGTKNAAEAFIQSYNIGAGKGTPPVTTSANPTPVTTESGTLGAYEIEVVNPTTGKTEVWNVNTKKLVRIL